MYIHSISQMSPESKGNSVEGDKTVITAALMACGTLTVLKHSAHMLHIGFVEMLH